MRRRLTAWLDAQWALLWAVRLAHGQDAFLVAVAILAALALLAGMLSAGLLAALTARL